MLRPEMACIEEVRRDILRHKNIKVLDIFVDLVGRGYSTNIESKLPFHDFEAADCQVFWSFLDVNKILMMPLHVKHMKREEAIWADQYCVYPPEAMQDAEQYAGACGGLSTLTRPVGSIPKSFEVTLALQHPVSA